MKLSDLQVNDVFRAQADGRTLVGLVLENNPDHMLWINPQLEQFTIYYGGPSDDLEVEHLGVGKFTPAVLELPPEAYK
jgi:hypothetical protein